MVGTEDLPPGDLYAVPLVLQPQPSGCEDMENDSIVMQRYEVPLVPQPLDLGRLHPISPLLQEREAQPARQWMRHCAEAPGEARGWVQEVFPMHNTMLYSMCLAGDRVFFFEGTVEGPGQATGEQGGVSVCRASFFAHSPPVPVFAPPHQTIWSTFSLCLRIWPILCTEFMTMARVVGSGGRDSLRC